MPPGLSIKNVETYVQDRLQQIAKMAYSTKYERHYDTIIEPGVEANAVLKLHKEISALGKNKTVNNLKKYLTAIYKDTQNPNSIVAYHYDTRYDVSKKDNNYNNFLLQMEGHEMSGASGMYGTNEKYDPSIW